MNCWCPGYTNITAYWNIATYIYFPIFAIFKQSYNFGIHAIIDISFWYRHKYELNNAHFGHFLYCITAYLLRSMITHT